MTANTRKKLWQIAGRVLLLWIGLSCSASAATLADYHTRLDTARSNVRELQKYSDDKNRVLERGKINAIRLAVSVAEKVEWRGGEIETDNGWLKAELDEFAAEPDQVKRGTILNGIEERLLALSETTAELEKSVEAGRTKDEDKQKLGEILKREEYQKPQEKEESLFQKWLREFLEWLGRAFPRPPQMPESPAGVGSIQFGLQILIYVIVIALVAFLIYKFAPYFARRFGSRTKRDKTDRVILGERIARDESAENLFDEAERLAREGDLRGAIRKGYIAILCELSDRKVIGLARHKTNRDYLRDVRKNQGLFANMTGLTGSFERNWYGLGQAEMRDWEDFRDGYKRTISEVRG